MTQYPLDVPSDAEFHKSSYSNDHQGCVEVAETADGGRWLRDTKDRNRPAHYYTPVEWQAFVAGVKNGEFD
ncbi:DUF397 domain-containing protein [Actinopolyspora erythraea]|uniref:DUF397 domain-containing protein n=1 Tax=Actinopolyspora erythraea TaxID=414996 RepID=A0A099D3B3_9ACTN|nr:DUF397 domain-containing protein [Actinopolyspora erythraea]ASU79149.1 DUF397 domain-containing protein [Actinopolyspora erythraea]KGI80668.1 hypothetical protein IL38_16205 [Actinopolyspora erythraea]